jgi:hypothetical protein
MTQWDIIEVLRANPNTWHTAKEIETKANKKIHPTRLLKIKGLKHIEFREAMLNYPRSQRRTTQYRWKQP